LSFKLFFYRRECKAGCFFNTEDARFFYFETDYKRRERKAGVFFNTEDAKFFYFETDYKRRDRKAGVFFNAGTQSLWVVKFFFSNSTSKASRNFLAFIKKETNFTSTLCKEFVSYGNAVKPNRV